jgi:hypothetical protein
MLSHSQERKNSNVLQVVWFASVRQRLTIIILIAVGLRVASAFVQGQDVVALPGIYDQISYDGLARRLMAGNGFSFGQDHWPATRAGEPTAHWSYLYTSYLAAIYTLFGAHPLVARLIQAVVTGILHCWLAYRVTRRIFGSTVGMVAAGLSAAYIYFFYYAGALITEAFFISTILWTFDVALRIAGYTDGSDKADPSPATQRRLWLELGLAIGITVLLRQLFLLFVPFLYLWLWWILQRSTNHRQASLASAAKSEAKKGALAPVQGFLLATAVVALLILPWTVRNYRAFDLFVPLNTNSGYAFFWGNHPIYGTNFVGILPNDGPSYYQLIPPELLHLNEAELDQALLKRGLAFVMEDPKRYILLSVSRTREYFKFWPSVESSTLSNIARVGSFGLALPFMLHGLFLSLVTYWQPRHERRRSALMLLYMFILVYTTIHLLSWALIRYRLPVDAIFLCFAAYSIVDLVERYRSRTVRS